MLMTFHAVLCLQHPRYANSSLSPLPCRNYSPFRFPLPPVTAHRNKNPESVFLASSSKPTTPKSVSRWSVKRDATADPVLDVALVCTFEHKRPVYSIRSSADGKYLAAALGNHKAQNNGMIVIYDVPTGTEIWSVSAHRIWI